MKNGGLETLEALEKKHGPLPNTVCVATGSGGRHYYFKMPAVRQNNSQNDRTGLDIRADGGLIVAPGSVHANGKPYEWVNDFTTTPILEAPSWLLSEIEALKKGTPQDKIEAVHKEEVQPSLFNSRFSPRADKDQILNRLEIEIEGLCQYLLPNGKRQGDKWRVGNVRGEPGSSMNVALAGEKAGLWKDFQSGQSGNAITLWSENRNCEVSTAWSEATSWLGVEMATKTGVNAPQVVPEPCRTELPRVKTGETRYVYTNEAGEPVLFVIRKDKSDGSKTFSQWGPSDTNIEWIPGTRNVLTPYPLYQLNRIATGLEEEVVIIHEGEKSVLEAERAGLTGSHTTTLGGAGNPSKTDFSPLFGRDIVISPDNDDAGIEYARQVSQLAYEAGAQSVRTLELNDLPLKGDVADWLQDGGSGDSWEILLQGSALLPPPPPPLSPKEILSRAIEELRAGNHGAHWEKEVLDAAKILNEEDPAEFTRVRAEIKSIGSEVRITDWTRSVTAGDRLAGDDSIVRRMTDHAAKNLELFHDSQDRCYAIIHDGARQIWDLQSKAIFDWISYIAYTVFQESIAETSFVAIVRSLSGIAKHDGVEQEVYLRCAPYQDGYIIDLADAQWQAVEVSPDGFQLVSQPNTLFVRSKTSTALPIPTNPDIDLLKKYVNIRDEDWTLYLTFLLDCFRPDTPYPVLLLTGGQGTGKSFTHRYTRQVVDPNSIPLRRAPRSVDDIPVAAANNYLVCFENMSHLTKDMQDALCTLSTGGGFATRQLYTNFEEAVAEMSRPVAINGISTVVTRPDLLDRTIHLNLPKIESYADVRDIDKKFVEDRPAIFTGLLKLFSDALKILPQVEISSRRRLVDYIKLGEAVHRVLGRTDKFFELYEANRSSSLVDSLESSPASMALYECMQAEETWEGTVQGLLDRLNSGGSESLPRTARGLSDTLRRMAPALEESGISVEFLKHEKDGRHVRILNTEYRENDRHNDHDSLLI